MFWPSSEKHLDLIEGILLHEYHHIGLIHWLEKYDNNFKKYSDGTSFAKYLMLSIMSEGAATYFFNDGDDIYPLIVESHGEETASSIRASMQNRGENIECYIRDLETDLLQNFEFEGEIEQLRTLCSKYTFSSSTEPLDKSIGYHMCSVIDENLGLETLLNCFVNPNEFVYKYNDALKENDNFRFTEAFIQTWRNFTS